MNLTNQSRKQDDGDPPISSLGVSRSLDEIVKYSAIRYSICRSVAKKLSASRTRTLGIVQVTSAGLTA